MGKGHTVFLQLPAWLQPCVIRVTRRHSATAFMNVSMLRKHRKDPNQIVEERVSIGFNWNSH